MIRVKRISSGEEDFIIELERKLDLEVPQFKTSELWIIEEGNEPVGLARITDLGPAYFLSSVGLLPQKRGRGLATQLLQAILAERKKDVYLYTIIPEFFFRFGFEITKVPSFLPPRDIFSCHLCEPKKCFCLVKRC
ncbi:MAG: GNAT family N-acetyltransferase [Candidatus Aminicenantes bacterium]|nr:GNAT family N-acetyltransferase [Candidatus Aminicenantes bacterium]